MKMTFAKGAFLKDPSGLFNASLEGNIRRAIDVHKSERSTEGAEGAHQSCGEAERRGPRLRTA